MKPAIALSGLPDHIACPSLKGLRKAFMYYTMLCCLFFAGIHISAAQPFIHPGLLHTQSDLDRMRTKVAASAQPWKAGWDVLVANPISSLSVVPGAVDSVFRGLDGVHPENYSRLFRDAASAYETALRWQISGDTAYANKSIQILNAWSNTLKYMGGSSDVFLLVGIQGYQLANAGELMRNYSGWAPADFTTFKAMMLIQFYSRAHSFLVNHNGACISNYWANWDLCNLATVLSIGVLCDDRTIYNEAINYFYNGAGSGAAANLVPSLFGNIGQWQESGRDQGHTVLGVALAGSLCEMAWNQGDDLYSYDNNRLLKGYEYIAKYNLGYTVPFTTYTNCTGVIQTTVSDISRGDLRPVWALVMNHYVRRKGLSAPYVELMTQTVQPEGGGGNYGPNSGGYDQLGFGTLAFTLDAPVMPNSQTITFPAISNKNISDPDFSPGAIASSGLTVVYSSSNLAVATVNDDNTIHVIQPGTTTIRAYQAGDATYNAAPIVTQSLVVNPVAGAVSGTWSNTAGTSTTAISSVSGSPVLTWPGQTFEVGEPVRLSATVPGGFTANTSYNVVAATGNTFQLAAIAGGTPINATTTITNGTGLRYQKWLTASNWSSTAVAGGVYSTATFGGITFANIPGVTLNDTITIGTLLYAAGGTSELRLASGTNGGALKFQTLTGKPSLIMNSSGARKLFMGETFQNGTTPTRIPLRFIGTQGLIINTPIYGNSGSYAGLRIQASMDWSGLSGGIEFQQGTIEIHNNTTSTTIADNVILPMQHISMGTTGPALLLFSGNSGNSQTIGALDGTTDAYIAARNNVTNGAFSLTFGADDGSGYYEGSVGHGNVAGALDSGRVNIIKAGTGTQTMAGVIYDGTTGTNHTSVTVSNGKLALNAANRYTGPTIVNGGVLSINGSGMSAVTVNAGQLNGNGTNAAGITIGTGSGSGAVIAPGNSIGTITAAGTVMLKADATYAVEFNSSNAAADKITAGGITLENAALAITDIGSNTALPAGTAFTIADNTAATPVSGTFAGLQEGAVISSGLNTFQLSYTGGTGNDIVLTVTSSTLPVTLIDYTAKAQNNGTVLLSWSTAGEINNHHFTVEHSTNGQNFTLLTTVPSVNRNNTYTITDDHAKPGINYYQLTQTDKDGTTKIIGTRIVRLQSGKPWTVYPTLVNESFYIKAGSTLNEPVIIKLYDQTGRMVFSSNVGLVITGSLIPVQLDKAISSGNYLLQINDQPPVKLLKVNR